MSEARPQQTKALNQGSASALSILKVRLQHHEDVRSATNMGQACILSCGWKITIVGHVGRIAKLGHLSFCRIFFWALKRCQLTVIGMLRYPGDTHGRRHAGFWLCVSAGVEAGVWFADCRAARAARSFRSIKKGCLRAVAMDAPDEISWTTCCVSLHQ